MESLVTWKSGLTFSCTNRDVSSAYSDVEAPTPKEGVLNALCACSGMDVVELASKMRLELTSLSLEATAEKSATIPSFFSAVHVKYNLTGEKKPEKFIQAVVLSMTKHCGVSYMISQLCPVTYEVHLNDQLIYEDQAKFTLEFTQNA